MSATREIAPSAATQTVTGERGTGTNGPESRPSMRNALRRTEGFAAQEALLTPSTPVQKRSRTDGEGTRIQEAATLGMAGGQRALPYADVIQAKFGTHDVSGITAHGGEGAREACDAMGAEAYATGTHVVLGDTPDLHTVAHEAAHVVQQRAGLSPSGGIGKSGDALEQHADRVADAVVSGGDAESVLSEKVGATSGASTRAVQRQDKESGEGASPPDLSNEVNECSDDADLSVEPQDAEKKPDEAALPRDENEALASFRASKKPLHIPIRVNQAFPMAYGTSFVVDINVVVKAEPEGKVTGSLKFGVQGATRKYDEWADQAGDQAKSSLGKAFTGMVSYDFDKKQGGLDVSLGIFALSLQTDGSSVTLGAKADIMKLFVGGALEYINTATSGVVTLNPSGTFGAVVGIDRNGAWLKQVSSGVSLAIGFDALKLSETLQLNRMKRAKDEDGGELWDHEPGPEGSADAWVDAAPGNPDALTGDPTQRPTGVTGSVSGDVAGGKGSVEAGTSMGLGAGAEASFAASTDYARDGEKLTETNVAGAVKIWVQVGPLKFQLSKESNGKSIGTQEERTRLARGVMEVSVAEALRTVSGPPESPAARLQAAKRVNSAFQVRKDWETTRQKAILSPDGKGSTDFLGSWLGENAIFDIFATGPVARGRVVGEFVNGRADLEQRVAWLTAAEKMESSNRGFEAEARQAYELLSHRYEYNISSGMNTSAAKASELLEMLQRCRELGGTSFMSDPRISGRLESMERRLRKLAAE